MDSSVGRWSDINEVDEISDLETGMDFRKPEYRREVFLRFYQFHTKYKAHPGGVYYLIPALSEVFEWDIEEQLWWAFLNGNTQNPIISTIIMQSFPYLAETDPVELQNYLDTNWHRLHFDTDRRYWKKELANCVANYQRQLNGETQRSFFEKYCQAQSKASNFMMMWDKVRNDFYGFGRLSTWSYLEYLFILGLPIDPGTLFLEDRDGSKSLRNGLCKVLGRDDLDWHDSNPTFNGKYAPELIHWLDGEANLLLWEAKERMPNEPSISHFTLESTFCSYKSWFRPNRRYPNVYNDMMNERIKKAEADWKDDAGLDLDLFWQLRKAFLPKNLRLEDNPNDLGIHPTKQNHFRLTGQVIMMERDWSCFANDYSKRLVE
jgi:hypothetical protein